MPAPVIEPTPFVSPREVRFVDPLDAHDASYFAASARMASLLLMSSCGKSGSCSSFVLMLGRCCDKSGGVGASCGATTQGATFDLGSLPP